MIYQFIKFCHNIIVLECIYSLCSLMHIYIYIYSRTSLILQSVEVVHCTEICKIIHKLVFEMMYLTSIHNPTMLNYK